MTVPYVVANKDSCFVFGTWLRMLIGFTYLSLSPAVVKSFKEHLRFAEAGSIDLKLHVLNSECRWSSWFCEFVREINKSNPQG